MIEATTTELPETEPPKTKPPKTKPPGGTTGSHRVCKYNAFTFVLRYPG